MVAKCQYHFRMECSRRLILDSHRLWLFEMNWNVEVHLNYFGTSYRSTMHCAYWLSSYLHEHPLFPTDLSYSTATVAAKDVFVVVVWENPITVWDFVNISDILLARSPFEWVGGWGWWQKYFTLKNRVYWMWAPRLKAFAMSWSFICFELEKNLRKEFEPSFSSAFDAEQPLTISNPISWWSILTLLTKA